MQDLLGRLTALDPDASETLKVVSYFDALVARSVGVESLLRAAALLSGVTVGQRDGRQIVRLRADGVRIDPAQPSPGWMVRESGPDAVAWIERDGPAHTNDAMILERLALALGIVRARRAGGQEGAVELAISSYASADERAAALARLRLTSSTTISVIASPPDPAPSAQHPSAVVATSHGLTRATLLDTRLDLAQVWPGDTTPQRGVGLPGPGGELPRSWSTAMVAARLTSPEEPIVDASSLGAALLVAEAADAGPLHPDAAVLARLDPRSLELLDAIATEPSVRAAALQLGRHHSSVQERLGALIDTLGYDPRTPRGRTRYALARMLLTLAC